MRTPFRNSHGKITLVLYNRPHPCGGRCVFCFSTKGVTKSTTRNEDTLLSASHAWDGASVVEARLSQYGISEAVGNKLDLAVKGDSFANHSADYLEGYFAGIYAHLNGASGGSLEDVRAEHADAQNRVVTVKVETRPDHVTPETCELMARLGVTTVEIGVQSMDDAVLERVKRGHNTETVARATALLRAHGFEVGYQVMVGLPGSNPETDAEMLEERLWEPDFAPDLLKVYPCLLLRQSVADQPELRTLLKSGEWTPMDTGEWRGLLRSALPKMPPYVHINAIQRIMSPDHVEAGPMSVVNRTELKDVSHCLWTRSVAQKRSDLLASFADYRIQRLQQGPGNVCVVASLEDETVIGYGRVSQVSGDCAAIRDVRTLGSMIPIGEPAPRGMGCQHVGVGTRLLREMELVARDWNCERSVVKPGPGAVRWFEGRGYRAARDWRWIKPISLGGSPKVSADQRRI